MGGGGLLPADTLGGEVKSNLCGWQQQLCPSPETEFLDEIQTKVLRVFLLAFRSHLYAAWPWDLNFFKLTQPLTVSIVSLHCKGGKPDRKPYPLPHGLRNPYINLKRENSQDYAQKPQRNCTFMNWASGQLWTAGRSEWWTLQLQLSIKTLITILLR